MNVLKHMEAIFVVALATTAAASFAVGDGVPADARLPVLAMRADVPVVHVTARRMSAAEKRASLNAERAAGRTGARGVGRA